MAGIGVDLPGRPPLHDPARVHHVDPVGVAGHDAEVVGDDEHRDAELAGQVLQQLQDLGLDGHVERRGGLVGEDERRVAGQRHGDHDPLAHAAAELVRVLAKPPLRVRDPHQREDLRRPGPGLGGCHLEVDLQGLGDLPADGQHRVQRGHGLLEDHGDLAPPDAAHLVLGEREEIPPLEEDLAADDPPRGSRHEPHHRERADGLAAAGLAHQGHGLPGLDVPGDAIHGAHDATAGGELGLEIPHVEEDIHGPAV